MNSYSESTAYLHSQMDCRPNVAQNTKRSRDDVLEAVTQTLKSETIRDDISESTTEPVEDKR